MGGDLNLKKSWHPVLMSNQRRVWEEEKKALEERKRIDQMMKERQEERQIQELQEMQEAAGGKKRLNRVDWMYSGPSSGQAGTTEEMEGYLLGKRRIDGLLKGSENKKLEKAASQESFMALQHANTVKDTASKIRDDPMLAIKKQEQAAYEAMMNDPVKRRQLLQAAEGLAPVKVKDQKHRKHRHHHDREDRKRHDHDESHHHSRHYKRRRTDERDDHRYHREERYSNQRRSPSSSYSRSPSPHTRRSPSPYYHAKRSSPPRRRSRSPVRYGRDDHRLKQSKSWSSPRRTVLSSDLRQEESLGVDNRAAKLAAMQQAANDLDQDREKRIAAIADRDQAEKEKEAAAREKASRYGGKGGFVNGLRRKAGELDIGERMRRNRGDFEKD